MSHKQSYSYLYELVPRDLRLVYKQIRREANTPLEHIFLTSTVQHFGDNLGQIQKLQ